MTIRHHSARTPSIANNRLSEAARWWATCNQVVAGRSSHHADRLTPDSDHPRFALHRNSRQQARPPVFFQCHARGRLPLRTAPRSGSQVRRSMHLVEHPTAAGSPSGGSLGRAQIPLFVGLDQRVDKPAIAFCYRCVATLGPPTPRAFSSEPEPVAIPSKNVRPSFFREDRFTSASCSKPGDPRRCKFQ